MSMRPPIQVFPEELVAHLTKVAENDMEKVRCLVRWIAKHIQYEVDIFNHPGTDVDCTLMAVLKTGRAICEGYSTVLKALCK